MCGICGCGGDGATVDGIPVQSGEARDGSHVHVAADGTVTRHDHGHDHGQGHHHHHHDDPDPVPGHGHAPDSGAARLIRIEQDLLAKNDRFAAVNRQLFSATGTLALNLMSSPGSGKTTLLVRTLETLRDRFPIAVIEGDQQTSFDVDRIRATGVPAVQINTGKGCHLDAQMVTQAVGTLGVSEGSILFIENVGNLVCPAGFDLGERVRVVVLSVTEGEDKPLKYPDMFASADLLLINKIDLLPYITFDLDRLIGYARRLRPNLPVIQISATTGAGFADWLHWIEQQREFALAPLAKSSAPVATAPQAIRPTEA
ncbi:MAG: hydrogenase nickel incorporation protein HypB [Azospirillaceae bacterium]|nr:hydrogenase nickel incorporation protein HypB [Azospirillaceae bacterium]